MNDRRDTWLIALNWATAVVMLLALYMAFIQAPNAAVRTPDEVFAQRIIYFHIPAAWIGFLAFSVTFVASVAYLRTSARKWDVVALSSVEIGIAFFTMVLITGSLWAKVAWNTWWTWDPRLTISTICWLMYIAYLMLRTAIDDQARRARFSAVFGIVAFVTVPLDFMAIRWWRTIHPIIFDTEGFGLSSNMMFAFLFCLGAFTVLYFTLLIHRVRLEHLADEVEALKQRLSH